LGEGGTGIFWFIYRWDQGVGTGLVNNPTLYAEVADLARRAAPLKDLLLRSHKIDDRIVIADPNAKAYASTLASSDGKYYVIAVNRGCQAQNLALRGYSLTGQLRDLETGQIFDLNSPIGFRAGDGKIFEVINPRAITPIPTSPDLVQNSSFEAYAAGYPPRWSPLPNASRDATVARTGSVSLKVNGVVANLSEQTVTLKPNTRYYLSGWVKAQNVAGEGIALRYVQTSPEIEVIDYTSRVRGTRDWTQIQTTFTTPPNYVNGRLDILMDLESGEVAWVEDVSLCEGTTSCASVAWVGQ